MALDGCSCPECQTERARTDAEAAYYRQAKTSPDFTPYGSEAAQSMDRDYALADRAERMAARLEGLTPVDGSPLARIGEALARLERDIG